MKCYIHVGLRPEPKVANSPVEAITLAEKYLQAENDEFPEEESLSVKWRRDDLYPDNFIDYSVNDLLTHLQDNGEVVLQLAEIDADGLPIMGEIANILTAAEEEKDTREADEALEKLGSSLAQGYKTTVTLHRAGKSKTFQPGGGMTVSMNKPATPTAPAVTAKPKTAKVTVKKPTSKQRSLARKAAKKRLKNPTTKKK